MKKITMSLVIILTFYLLVQLFYTQYFLRKSSDLVNETSTLRQTVLGDPKNPSFKLFIDGDSVAAGVGATDFDSSVAGRIAGLYSKEFYVQFKNSSHSGKKMSDLIDSEAPKEKQDLIILIVSSNDLFKFTNMAGFEESTKEVLGKYSSLTKKLVIVGPGNLGDAKALPFFVRWFYNARSLVYQKVLTKETQNYANVRYVKVSGVNSKQYGDILARDKFHPNDKGHEFWFDTIKPSL